MNARLFLFALLAGAAIPMTAAAQTATDDPSAVTRTYPYQRPPDVRGINVFEAPKTPAALPADAEFPRLRLGGSFTQQFQALDHSNTPNVVPNLATPDPNDTIDTNALIEIGNGFNLATANLTVNAMLAPGLQVNLDTYLSSRHHPETWVKGGYIQVDELGFLGVPALERVMDYTTIRLGHYEINYGDAHFRRSDNGNAFFNPFVENLIMDAFTTEIGGDILVRKSGFLGMVGVTGGEIQGGVTRPEERSLAVLGKVGYDAQMSPDLRVRLTGSAYHNGNALGSTLYAGDRGGSRYYLVMEPPTATTSANFTSGRLNPGFREAVTAFMVNPFVKFMGFELFGTYERATGRMANESEDVGRVWQQFAVEGLYRFLPGERAYVGARYNVADGNLLGPVVAGQVTDAGAEVSVDRIAIAAGWFPTRNLLLKGEYVRQNYNDFPTADIRNGGEFNGFVIEGVVSF